MLFRVRSHAAYHRLAPLIRSLVRPRDIEDAVLDKLRAGSPMERFNARDLEYYLFGAGGADYRMSPAARAEFEFFAARLEAAADPRSREA